MPMGSLFTEKVLPSLDFYNLGNIQLFNFVGRN